LPSFQLKLLFWILRCSFQIDSFSEFLYLH
jgi:hypothetical protein